MGEELGCSDHVFHSPRNRCERERRPGPRAGVVRRSSGDRPLLPSRDGGHLQRHRPPRPLAGDRAPGHRGVVRARCRAVAGRGAGPVAGAGRRRRLRRRLRGAGAGHGPRRGRVRRRRPGGHRRRGRARGRQVDPLRPHVVRRRGHRVVLDAPRRRGSAARRVRRAGRHAQGDGAAPPRHRHDRAHPRHPRRADDVRDEGGAVVPAGRPRSGPPALGPGGRGGRQAAPARSGRTPTSTPSSSATCAPRSA